MRNSANTWQLRLSYKFKDVLASPKATTNVTFLCTFFLVLAVYRTCHNWLLLLEDRFCQLRSQDDRMFVAESSEMKTDYARNDAKPKKHGPIEITPVQQMFSSCFGAVITSFIGEYYQFSPSSFKVWY